MSYSADSFPPPLPVVAAMSRHEGVSCDSCLKSNFRGRRYKCLVCFDYDLCANCYEVSGFDICVQRGGVEGNKEPVTSWSDFYISKQLGHVETPSSS